MVQPKILALDFDGVLCNGLKEYFLTASFAYSSIWSEDENLEQHRNSFYLVRPVVETGWEMPLLLRALILGKSEQDIRSHWGKIVEQLLEKEQIKSSQIMHQIDLLRDQQIESNLEQWLSLHQFYPGIIDKLKDSLAQDISIYIITTKEGRFVQKLLQAQGINLPENNLKGKEVKQSKAQTLIDIISSTGIKAHEIWFVEDRLEALQSAQREDQLKGIKLYLAEWGYNLIDSREKAKKDKQISLLSLNEFLNSFAKWPVNKHVRHNKNSG